MPACRRQGSATNPKKILKKHHSELCETFAYLAVKLLCIPLAKLVLHTYFRPRFKNFIKNQHGRKNNPYND